MKYHYGKGKDRLGNDELTVSGWKENKYMILSILSNKEQKIVHISYSTSADTFYYINTEHHLTYEITEEAIKEILELAADAIPDYTPQIIRIFAQLPKQEIRL